MDKILNEEVLYQVEEMNHKNVLFLEETFNMTQFTSSKNFYHDSEREYDGILCIRKDLGHISNS